MTKYYVSYSIHHASTGALTGHASAECKADNGLTMAQIQTWKRSFNQAAGTGSLVHITLITKLDA